MKKLALVLILILIIGSIWYLQRPDMVILSDTGEELVLGTIGKRVNAEKGVIAQDFRLIDYDGNIHKLSDYRGKPILLNFWTTWCPFCIEEMPLFEKMRKEFTDKDLEIIAINRAESIDQAKKFTDKMNLSYTILIDRKDAVYSAYNLQAMPTTFFIKPNGEIQNISFGALFESNIRKKIQELIDESIDANISTSNTVKHSVPLEDILSGGPPMDGIPSIDNPKFTSVEEANKFLKDDGIGISFSSNEIDRFYPNQITVWHEIVNDRLGTQAALITYCPLCGTGIVFEPIIDGEVVEFGTSGKLWNSNLVMYDRKTESYWSQALGEAIVGELTGKKLKILPHENIRWKDWKKKHPDGQVLSKETGYDRDYSGSPYGSYDTNDSIFFPVDNKDDRYHEKEPTYGVVLGGFEIAFPRSELEKGPSRFTYSMNGINLDIKYTDSDKTIDIVRTDTGEKIIPIYGFWFSWISIHPGTEVYTAKLYP